MFTMTLWCLVGVGCGAMPYIKFEETYYPSEEVCTEVGKAIIDQNPTIPPGLWQVECRKVPTVDDSVEGKVG